MVDISFPNGGDLSSACWQHGPYLRPELPSMVAVAASSSECRPCKHMCRRGGVGKRFLDNNKLTSTLQPTIATNPPSLLTLPDTRIPPVRRDTPCASVSLTSVWMADAEPTRYPDTAYIDTAPHHAPTCAGSTSDAAVVRAWTTRLGPGENGFRSGAARIVRPRLSRRLRLRPSRRWDDKLPQDNRCGPVGWREGRTCSKRSTTTFARYVSGESTGQERNKRRLCGTRWPSYEPLVPMSLGPMRSTGSRWDGRPGRFRWTETVLHGVDGFKALASRWGSSDGG